MGIIDQAGAGGHSNQRRILVVDDDLATRDTITWAFNKRGVHVATAADGATGVALARSCRFDLMVLDLQLPDMLGVDVARTLRDVNAFVPFLLMSGFLTTDMTVAAMRLGAAHVLEKPVKIDQLEQVVLELLAKDEPSERVCGANRPNVGSPEVRRTSTGPSPGSAAERWARHVLEACHSQRDLPTLSDWARHVGASAGSLSETCYLVGIRPKDARDLLRLLRAVIRSRVHGCEPEALLNVSDRRTLKMLFERGSLTIGIGREGPSPRRFLAEQRFVDTNNEALKMLCALLDGESRSTDSADVPRA